MKGNDTLNALVAGLVVLLGGGATGAVDRDSAEWEPENKKVVSFGWEWNLSAQELLNHAARIDESGLDGIGIAAGFRSPDGKVKSASAYTLDAKDDWQYAWLERDAAIYRQATVHKGLSECFLWVMRSPEKRVEWEDDVQWARVARNMGVMAKFAKASGFRGLSLDPEDYTPAKQFDRHPGDRPWKEMAVLVRRRARQVFTEVFREFPEAVVLGFWLQSKGEHRHCHEQDPLYSLEKSNDLLPMFVNGILDAMPETAALVDGCEFGYQYDAAAGDFAQSAQRQRDAVYGLIAPENRSRFRQCFLPGFGLYITAFINAPKTKAQDNQVYYFPPYKGTRLGYFERNLAAAIRSTGKYVWIWSDKLSWIEFDKDHKVPTGQWGVSRELWSNRLPGLNHIIRACADPKAFLRKDFPALLREGRMPNLAAGEDFVQKSRVAMYGPTGKKADGKKGYGYFTYDVPDAEPGSHYVIVADGHGEGLEVKVAWIRRRTDPDVWHGGQWHMAKASVPMKPAGDGKYHGEMVVTVPEGAKCLQMQIDFNTEPGGECVVDSLYIGKVPVE